MTVKQGLIFTSCLRNHWYDSDFVTSIKWKRSMNIVCNIGWKYGWKIKRCYKNYCTCVVILCHTTEVFGITAVSIIRLDCLFEGRRLGDTYNVFIATLTNCYISAENMAKNWSQYLNHLSTKITFVGNQLVLLPKKEAL